MRGLGASKLSILQRRVLSSVIALSMVLSSAAQAGTAGTTNSTGALQVRSEATQQPLNVSFETREMSGDQALAELKLEMQSESDLLIVSSDSDEVLGVVAQESKTKAAGAVFALPFGKAVRASARLTGGVNEAILNSGHYLAAAFQKDKIGFGITTFSVSNEVVRWLHVTNASNFIITSNIIYSVLWSAVFIDKDRWSKTTKPIQKAYRKLFKMSEVIPPHPTLKDTSMKYLAGVSLSLAMNSGRVGLIAIDQLSRNVFEPMNLAMPFVMGVVMTAAGFSWSELIGGIDEAQFPKAKKLTRLVMNGRSVAISYLASSAMLLNYSQHGMSPWIALTVSGATGLILYTNMKKLTPRLERLGHKLLPKPRACSALFAGA